MSKTNKALLVSIGFLILWVGWCFLAINILLPILRAHMNMSPRIVGPVLCAIPFLLYAGGLIAWFKSGEQL